MVPEMENGNCYVSEKDYRPREAFKTYEEYCAQQSNVIFFIFPIILQLFAVIGYIALRYNQQITAVAVARKFNAFLVCSQIIIFEIVSFSVGVYHFMEGFTLLWLVGFSYRLQHLSFREKNYET